MTTELIERDLRRLVEAISVAFNEVQRVVYKETPHDLDESKVREALDAIDTYVFSPFISTHLRSFDSYIAGSEYTGALTESWGKYISRPLPLSVPGGSLQYIKWLYVAIEDLKKRLAHDIGQSPTLREAFERTGWPADLTINVMDQDVNVRDEDFLHIKVDERGKHTLLWHNQSYEITAKFADLLMELGTKGEAKGHGRSVRDWCDNVSGLAHLIVRHG